jgi:hypothetical protein
MVVHAPKYGQALRVIGQTLEELHLIAFSIRSEGKGYRIQGYGEESEPVELQYTNADIQHIDRKRRAMRSDPFGMPDFMNLSQLLRAAGSYLESQEGRLLAISRPLGAVSSFTLQYDTEEDYKEEEHLASSLHDYCLSMYRQRKGTSPK